MSPAGELRPLEPDVIQIPDLRVTSVVDPDMMAELEASIREQGILQPLQVAEIDGVYWLVDGLHRLLAARALGLESVPCHVSQGSADQILLQNLTVNRQRGKSNPAQEAQLIRRLREEGGHPLERIAQLTGLSVGVTRKLNDIAYLPPSVLDLIGQGRLGITHATELLRLRDESQQLETAQQAVEWKYTVEQVRARVESLLRPAAEPAPGSFGFDGTGKPSRVPLPCYLCHTDLTDRVSYLYLCGDCQILIDEFWRQYQRIGEAPPPPSRPPPADAPAPGGTGYE